MRKLLNFIFGRREETPSKKAPAVYVSNVVQPSAEVLERERSRKHALLLGLKVPATQIIDIMMPREDFATLASLKGNGEPVRFYSTQDFDGSNPERGKPQRERLAVSYEDGEFTIAHERQNMWVLTPHPENPSRRYPKPVFTELSSIHGFIEGKTAHVMTSLQIRPHGTYADAPAQPGQVEFYKVLRQIANEQNLSPMSQEIPPLPPPLSPEAQARIDNHVAETRAIMKLIGKPDQTPRA